LGGARRPCRAIRGRAARQGRLAPPIRLWHGFRAVPLPDGDGVPSPRNPFHTSDRGEGTPSSRSLPRGGAISAWIGFMDYRSRVEQLASHLRRQIGLGKLAGRLPGRHTWAAELGVGCNTLQGALRILHKEKLIYSSLRKGTFVSKMPSRSAAPRPLSEKSIQFVVFDHYLSPSNLWCWSQLMQMPLTRRIHLTLAHGTRSKMAEIFSESHGDRILYIVPRLKGIPL